MVVPLLSDPPSVPSPLVILEEVVFLEVRRPMGRGVMEVSESAVLGGYQTVLYTWPRSPSMAS